MGANRKNGSTYLIDLSESLQKMLAALCQLVLQISLKVLAHAHCGFVGDIRVSWSAVSRCSSFRI